MLCYAVESSWQRECRSRAASSSPHSVNWTWCGQATNHCTTPRHVKMSWLCCKLLICGGFVLQRVVRKIRNKSKEAECELGPGQHRHLAGGNWLPTANVDIHAAAQCRTDAAEQQQKHQRRTSATNRWIKTTASLCLLLHESHCRVLHICLFI